MKFHHFITLLMILVIVIIGCRGEFGYDIEQKVKNLPCCQTLAPSGSALVTFVWHDGEIIKAWYDDIETITDSTKIVRRRQAQMLINNLKK